MPGGHWVVTDKGFLFSLANDTVINGLKYTNLGFQYSWANYSNWTGSTANINHFIVLPGQIVGAIREDSTKKIWFKNFYADPIFLYDYPQPLPSDTELLIYDFGLSLYDTLIWDNQLLHKVLIGIDSIQLLDGSYRRKFLFSSFNPGPFEVDDFWIESVGGSLGLFSAFKHAVENTDFTKNWLNCFWQEGQYLFKQNIDLYVDCDYTSLAPTPTGIEEVDSECALKINPLPFYDLLNVQVPCERYSKFELFDVYGKKIAEYDLSFVYNRYDFSALAPGIYFLNFSGELGNRTEKILKAP